MTIQTAAPVQRIFTEEKLRDLREQFPALSRQVNGRTAVYFDGPGGTQVSRRVIDAVSSYYMQSNANAGGLFVTSEETDALVDKTRVAMSAFLNCDSDEVVFGANATTITFALSRAFGRRLKEGDEVVVTTLDHDCNVAPWQALEERGVVVRKADVNPVDCTLDMSDLASKVNEKTRLIAVGYASNATGTINDIAAIVKLARKVGALIYVDAVHYAPHGLIDVKALDCDFLVCSPYKFFAPHLGTLYGKREHLSSLAPYKVRPADPSSPICWETGTQSFESIAGVLAAIDYLADVAAVRSGKLRQRIEVSMNEIREYEKVLSERMIRGLLSVPGLELYGISDSARMDWRTPTFGFNIKGQSPEVVARKLAQDGVFSWNGNFYALGLTERLSLEDKGGMVRLGCVHYNTADEIDYVVDSLHRIATGS